MTGEIHTQKQLEAMKHWRATFRISAWRGSPRDHIVCLMKDYNNGGYLWKRPENAYCEKANIVELKKSVKQRRLQLISGKIPPLPRKRKEESNVGKPENMESGRSQEGDSPSLCNPQDGT